MSATTAADEAERGAGAFLSGLGLAQIVSWGTLIYAFPILAGPMAAELGWSRTEVYVLASVALATSGLAAWAVGSAVDRGRGRAIMAAGSVLAAAMLALWSRADGAALLVPAFIGIGIAQAMTLYEPGFAVVARRYGGDRARDGITALTLWGGFASTVFIPVTQLLLDRYGWRGALEGLALLHLVLCLPLHLALIDPRRDRPVPRSQTQGSGSATRWALRQRTFWALLVAFTLYQTVFTALSFHLYPLLAERGLPAADIVLAMALIGPAQVAGRVVVATVARRAGIRAVGAVTLLVLPGALALLLLPLPGFAPLALFAIVYGATNGIMTIVRGSAVPELLTRRAYGTINGILAGPAAVLRAGAPVLAAMLWQSTGSYDALLWLALGTGAIVVLAFLVAARGRPEEEG